MKHTDDPSLHCPLCRSTSVAYETGGYGGMVYRCKECGYSGAFILEIDDEAEDTIGVPESGVESFRAPGEAEEGFRVPLWVKILAILFVIVVLLYIF